MRYIKSTVTIKNNNMEKFWLIYFVLGILTLALGSYRAYYGKQSLDIGPLDSMSWFLLWWIYLPIFCVRYVKYKIKGKSI